MKMIFKITLNVEYMVLLLIHNLFYVRNMYSSAKHKSKANSHPCILESVLLYTKIHCLDRDFKVKKSPSEYRLLFSTPLW